MPPPITEMGLLDELLPELLALHCAVLDARSHACRGHPEEVEQQAFDALLAARRLDREIKMNVLPKIEHVRGVLRKARLEARSGRLMEAFLLLDGIHNVVAPVE